MSFKEFLFSEKRSVWLLRQLAFWAFWGFYFGMVRFLNPLKYKEAGGQFLHFWERMGEGFSYLFPQIFLVYPLIYFVLPRYLFRERYVGAFIFSFIFLMFSLIMHAFYIVSLEGHNLIYALNFDWLGSDDDTFYNGIFIAYLGAMNGALCGAALACSFKMYKHFYLKDLRNQQLQKENTDAQIRILMAQIHPHFLFNTLNNIYSQAQEESPRSAKMLMELSSMLRYVLDEGSKDKVPLAEELQMIKDYIHLEMIRYDEKLDIHVSYPGKTDDVYIAPLLLLPFIENCFKHGTSKMIEHPWINLSIELDDLTLKMILTNGKKRKDGKDFSRMGKGIQNVSSRLELLYNDKHKLEIKEDEEVFVVNLQIQLERMDPLPGQQQIQTSIPSGQEKINYATN
jgi:sensor histidine kinase YesM